MSTVNKKRLGASRPWVTALALAVAATPVGAELRTVDEPAVSGIRVQIDNDLFAGSDRDRDYTGGMAVTISGRNARDGALSLNPVLERLDRLAMGEHPSSQVRHARQVGLMVFTPQNTLASEPLTDDRPYASLLFVSNGRMQVDEDQRGAWSSSLTLGMLGLPLTERLHSAVHEVVGSKSPRGYDNQISAGGEPTARYTLARQRLWQASPSGRFDMKTTVQGSIGFLTEASAAVSMRIGRFNTPWWSSAPELADYIAAPVPVVAPSSNRPELYVFAGARLKARAYNAFLQGQFRHSAVRYSADDLMPVVGEAWLGVVTQILEQTQLSYSLNYQTAEFRDGKAARDVLWGAVQVSHAF